jgi:phage I-like protein
LVIVDSLDWDVPTIAMASDEEAAGRLCREMEARWGHDRGVSVEVRWAPPVSDLATLLGMCELGEGVS